MWAIYKTQTKNSRFFTLNTDKLSYIYRNDLDKACIVLKNKALKIANNAKYSG